MAHHDASEGFEGFTENSAEFLEQIEKLNEVWYVFVGLALVMALFAFFVHRNLVQQENIKASFKEAAANSTYNDKDHQNHNHNNVRDYEYEHDQMLSVADQKQLIANYYQQPNMYAADIEDAVQGEEEYKAHYGNKSIAASSKAFDWAGD